jgi:hypothetical protein
MVVYGGERTFAIVPLNCTPIRCLDARKPGADQPRHGEHQHQQQRPNRRTRARQMTAFVAGREAAFTKLRRPAKSPLHEIRAFLACLGQARHDAA